MPTHGVPGARQCCTWRLWAQVCVQLPRLWEILVIITRGRYKFPSDSTLSICWAKYAGRFSQPASPKMGLKVFFFPCSAELFLPVSLIKTWKLLKMFFGYKLWMSRVRSKGKQWNKRAIFKGCIFRTSLSAYASSRACNHQQLWARGDTNIIILVYKPSSE